MRQVSRAKDHVRLSVPDLRTPEEVISTCGLSKDRWYTISRSVIRFPIRASKHDMVGILVHGDNHFIVRGPLPDREAALALARHWSLIQIGASTPPLLDGWQIVSREFRDNLE